jgi:multiple sugar transport system permease protein
VSSSKSRTADRSSSDRGLVSPRDWRRPTVRYGLGSLHALLLVVLVAGALGPMLWLVKASLSTTQEVLRTPMEPWPASLQWGNLREAWSSIHLDLYFRNTVVIAAGSWFAQLLVATTGGFVLSVLRPRYARAVNALVMATLFVPTVVLLVPLYLTILDPPLVHHSLINSFWAVWLPAGASAFNVVLMKRFFDNLPREVFEAARVDGAGPFRLLWSVALPMSRPVLGVVSVFAVLASWKDFLWPLLVLPDPDRQPLSVRLPTLAGTTELDVFLAALLISTALPVVAFLIFQRTFLRGSGFGGAVKG